MGLENRNFGLDLVRAVAIVLVLISHFVVKVDILGFYGVELFFGLSGYLIGRILIRTFFQTGTFSLKQLTNFWQRRWWRTLPLFYLFLLVSVIFHYYFGGLPSLSELIKFAFFSPFLTGHQFGFFVVSWSLFIEEWFYLIFPVLLTIFSTSGWRPQITFPLSLFFLLISSFVMKVIFSELGEGSSLRWITLARLDSIGYGVLIAYLNYAFSKNSMRNLLFFFSGIGLLFAPFFIFIFLFKIPFTVFSQYKLMLIITPLGAALLLPFVENIKKAQKVPSWINSSIERLSLWSYSLYLSHFPILFSSYALMENFNLGAAGNLIAKITALIASFGCSAFLFKYFELPFMNRRVPELNLKNSVSAGKLHNHTIMPGIVSHIKSE